MTRKDYILLASTIKRVYAMYGNPLDKDLIVHIAEELCKVLKSDNPNFDVQKFLSACFLL